jgi:hypothetical protein
MIALEGELLEIGRRARVSTLRPLTMQTTPTNMTIADYCQAMERNEIKVNREYQRSDKVWPRAARSFLIETILLGFPMPKFALYQVTDLPTRKVIKEVVDGQQRSSAILDFYQNKLRLTRNIETESLKGLTYSKLEPEDQQRFLDYALTIDLFVGSTSDEIREVFRRINSYTVPLSPEEQRHAEFQGKFKWFINRLSRRLDESFSRIGLFGDKQLVRMKDTKLLAEIVHALNNGVQTTSIKALRDLYRDFNASFPDENKIDRQLTQAFDQIIGWTDLHNTAVMKPHQIYALTLALIHMRTPIDRLEGLYKSPGQKMIDSSVAIPRLTTLAEMLNRDLDVVPQTFKPFARASSEKTNVRETREVRFVTYCKALDSRSKRG